MPSTHPLLRQVGYDGLGEKTKPLPWHNTNIAPPIDQALATAPWRTATGKIHDAGCQEHLVDRDVALANVAEARRNTKAPVPDAWRAITREQYLAMPPLTPDTPVGTHVIAFRTDQRESPSKLAILKGTVRYECKEEGGGRYFLRNIKGCREYSLSFAYVKRKDAYRVYVPPEPAAPTKVEIDELESTMGETEAPEPQGYTTAHAILRVLTQLLEEQRATNAILKNVMLSVEKAEAHTRNLDERTVRIESYVAPLGAYQENAIHEWRKLNAVWSK